VFCAKTRYPVKLFFPKGKTFFSREKDLVSQEEDFLSLERDLFSREKDFLSREEDFLSQEKDLFSREKDFLSLEKKLLSLEEDLFSQEKDLACRRHCKRSEAIQTKTGGAEPGAATAVVETRHVTSLHDVRESGITTVSAHVPLGTTC
jgi:hypothetical protein